MAMETPAVSLACPVQPGCSVVPVLVAPLSQGMWLLGPLASRSASLLLCWPRACHSASLRQVWVALWAWQGRLLCYPGQVKLPCRASSSVIPGQIALLALQFALGWATEVPALG